MSKKPPKFPWIKGVQPEYRSFDILVSVCQDNDGGVFSIHKLASDADEEVCNTLPSRGLEQIAFGLLVEAIRREAFLEILLKQSDDDSLFKRYSEGLDKERELILREIASAVGVVMNKSIQASSQAATAEIMEMILLSSVESDS